MKYQLIVSDFDRTFGKAPCDIPKESIEAVNGFINRGGKFSIITGRSFYSIKNICDFYGIRGLVASCQGSYIADIETNRPIYCGGHTPETAVKVIKRMNEDGIYCVAVIGDRTFIQKGNPATEIFIKTNVSNVEVVEDVFELITKTNKKVCTIFGIVYNKYRMEMIERYSKVFDQNEVIVNSGSPYLLEFINPNASKGEAVRRLADYYGITLDKVMAVGDSTNDIKLLDGEWHGVAVGDAEEQLKAYAKEVTVPFEQMPIKVLIEKYCK